MLRKFESLMSVAAPFQVNVVLHTGCIENVHYVTQISMVLYFLV